MGGRSANPEIIPPSHKVTRTGKIDDETLAALTSIFDDAFQIPGTNIRFGIDPLIGLIPGLGDLISSLASCLLVLAAWQRGLPVPTIGRMVVNVAVDSLVGAIPLLGDMFDVAWKANRKNLKILQRHGGRASSRETWLDWLFLIAVGILLILLLALPVLVFWLLVNAVRGY